MPFTPFHLGVGATAKGLLCKHVSFVVFGGSQVLMDIQPGIALLTGHSVLHGWSHTILGATLIGVVAALIGKPIGQLFLKLIGFKHWHISWRASFLSAFIGTYSHVLLDAIMHLDMQPLSPIASANPLLGVISVPLLHYICLGLLLFGGSLVLLRCVNDSKV